jgi:hypothetical protein
MSSAASRSTRRSASQYVSQSFDRLPSLARWMDEDDGRHCCLLIHSTTVVQYRVAIWRGNSTGHDDDDDVRQNTPPQHADGYSDSTAARARSFSFVSWSLVARAGPTTSGHKNARRTAAVFTVHSSWSTIECARSS